MQTWAQFCYKMWGHRFVWNLRITKLREKNVRDMAYYTPTVWKSGGGVPRVPQLIAPMHAVMSLQFTHVPSIACRGGLTSKSRGKVSLDLNISSKVRRFLGLFPLLFKRETSAVLWGNAVISTLHSNCTFHCAVLQSLQIVIDYTSRLSLTFHPSHAILSNRKLGYTAVFASKITP